MRSSENPAGDYSYRTEKNISGLKRNLQETIVFFSEKHGLFHNLHLKNLEASEFSVFSQRVVLSPCGEQIRDMGNPWFEQGMITTSLFQYGAFLGVPPIIIPFLDGMFHDKPSIFWGFAYGFPMVSGVASEQNV